MTVKIIQYDNGELSAFVEFEKEGYKVAEYLFNDCHADNDEGKAIYNLIKYAHGLEADNKRLREENAQFRNALEIYANKGNWLEESDFSLEILFCIESTGESEPGYKIAQEALKNET